MAQGTSPELGLQSELPGLYLERTGPADCDAVLGLLGAAAKLAAALGGHVLGRPVARTFCRLPGPLLCVLSCQIVVA